MPQPHSNWCFCFRAQKSVANLFLCCLLRWIRGWPWQRLSRDLHKYSQQYLQNQGAEAMNSWGIALELMRNRAIRIALNQSSFEVTEKSARFHTDWACIERIRDFRRCKASRDVKCSPSIRPPWMILEAKHPSTYFGTWKNTFRSEPYQILWKITVTPRRVSQKCVSSEWLATTASEERDPTIFRTGWMLGTRGTSSSWQGGTTSLHKIGGTHHWCAPGRNSYEISQNKGMALSSQKPEIQQTNLVSQLSVGITCTYLLNYNTSINFCLGLGGSLVLRHPKWWHPANLDNPPWCVLLCSVKINADHDTALWDISTAFQEGFHRVPLWACIIRFSWKFP